MSILVVDDSQDDLQLLKTMLGSAGYRDILVADSAESAYRVLGIKDASQTAKIDLILLDVLMPLNGIQVCRHIKSIDRLRDIPVIIVAVAQSVRSIFSWPLPKARSTIFGSR